MMPLWVGNGDGLSKREEWRETDEGIGKEGNVVYIEKGKKGEEIGRFFPGRRGH